VSAGDLAATGMAEVLEQLATDAATGCLHVAGPDGTEALVYLRTGEVYAMTVPGRRPQLGARLVSAGALAPDSLYEAVQAQHTELQGWRLSELLVHLGYVDQDVVEAFVVEQLHDCCTDLLDWTPGSWRFRAGERTRDDVAPATSVADLLARVVERQLAWEQMAATVPDAQAVPTLSTGAVPNPELTLEPESFALLCHVDGRRTVAELGRECGFTDLEAARVVHALVESGLLTVAATSVDDEAVARNAVPTDAWEPSAWDPAAWDPAAWDPTDATPTTGMEESLARVSQSLEAMIAAPAAVEPAAVEPDDAGISTSAGTAALPAGWLDGQLDDEQAIEVMRQERSRAMAAAELASAHAAELAEQEARQAADEATERLAAEQAVAERAAADAADAAQRASANERAAAETEAWTEYVRMEQEYAAQQAAAAAGQEAEQHAATEASHQAAEAARLAEDATRREAEEQARRVAAEASRAEAEQDARRQAEQAGRADAEEQAGRAAEERARRNAEEAARREAGEQARREAAAMLNEITQYTPTPRAKAAPSDDRTADRPASNDDRESPVVPPARPPAVTQPAYRAGRSGGEREETDTASLLRELSSLGQEDRPRPAMPPPAPRPAPRPAQPDKSGKRRKGMFGR